MKWMIPVFVMMSAFSLGAFAANEADVEGSSIDTVQCLTGACYSSTHRPKLTDNEQDDLNTANKILGSTDAEKKTPTKSETNK